MGGAIPYNPLIITTGSPLPGGTTGVAYSQQLAALGGTPPYTWSLVSDAGSSNTWTVSSVGIVSGTPTTVETDTLRVQVEDTKGVTTQAVFSITVILALSITTTSPLPDATVSDAYTDTLAAQGGVPPYTWSLLSDAGSSNTWAVSSSGVVSGTPTVAETDSLVVQVQDTVHNTAQQTFLLPVVAAGQTFDYYISTTGSNSNPGTVASPWAITAINDKQSTYAGTRVGLLPGVYNLYSLCQAGSYATPALQVQGGTTSSPTYIGSSNASGFYQRGTALLSGDSSGGLNGGAYPTVGCALIGQPFTFWPEADGGEDAGTPGCVTIDGLYLTRAYNFAISFYGANSQNIEGCNNAAPAITIQNCEIFDIFGNGGDNPGGIILYACQGALIKNNLIHYLNITGQGDHVGGFFTQTCYSNTYEYNTIYDILEGFLDKNTQNGNHTYQYNYVECLVTGAYAPMAESTGGTTAGDISTVHHNILIGPQTWDGSNETEPSNEGVVYYNNTAYCPSNPSGGYMGIFTILNGSSSNGLKHWNNIYCSPEASGYLNDLAVPQGAMLLSDYNCYQPNSSTDCILLSTASDLTAGTYYDLPAWQEATGFDEHSIATTTPGFSNPVPIYPAGFQIESGAVCYGTGRVGGTSSGAACNMGAWDGTITQIGSSITPIVWQETPSPSLVNSVTSVAGKFQADCSYVSNLECVVTSTSSTAPTLIDSVGQTWTLRETLQNTADGQYAWLYTIVNESLTQLTVTASWGASVNNAGIWLREISRTYLFQAATGAYQDGPGTAVNAISSGSLTPSSQPALLSALCISSSSAIAIGSPFQPNAIGMGGAFTGVSESGYTFLTTAIASTFTDATNGASGRYMTFYTLYTVNSTNA